MVLKGSDEGSRPGRPPTQFDSVPSSGPRRLSRWVGFTSRPGGAFLVPGAWVGFAVRFNIHNHRPVLEAEFLELTHTPRDDAALLHRGCEGGSGTVPDSACPTRAPLESVHAA